MTMARNRVAAVFCVHHKPWLAMSTVLTTLLQDFQDVDVHFAHNVGDGNPVRPGYAEYYEAAAKAGANAQLSPYDERVRDVCRINRPGVIDIEYENDQSLDSGTWYKFIRDGRWRAYEWTLFAGEGTLLARPNLLSAMLSFADRRRAHVIVSGHEKRRLPKALILHYNTRAANPGVLDRLHDRSTAEVFRIFCRDPAFEALFDAWSSDVAMQTENHTPDLRGSALGRRVRASVQQRWGSPYRPSGDPDGSPVYGRIARAIPLQWDGIAAGVSLRTGRTGDGSRATPHVYAQGRRRPLPEVVSAESERGVWFHTVADPAWFGCATIHLMSRTFLERLSEMFERHAMYDVLDVPFAGTALEVAWGFFPAWLGFEKFFTDGFHRVRKHPVTYVREDYPPEMASYINRYHRGRVSVGWDADYLKVKGWHPMHRALRTLLPSVYFPEP